MAEHLGPSLAGELADLRRPWRSADLAHEHLVLGPQAALSTKGRPDGRHSALAADLGFADHPDLTRTLSEQLDHTPSQLRRMLRA